MALKKRKPFIRWVLKIEVCSCAAILKKKNSQKQFSLSSFRVSDSCLVAYWRCFSLYSTPERTLEAYTDDGNIWTFSKQSICFKIFTVNRKCLYQIESACKTVVGTKDSKWSYWSYFSQIFQRDWLKAELIAHRLSHILVTNIID